MSMCGACRKSVQAAADASPPPEVPKAGRRKPKIGEQLEVLNYPPQLRGLALELPRSYREKALAHWAAQNIDLSDPSDWELEEIQSYLTAQAAIYQRKAGYVRAHSERRRVAAWEARQLEATPTDDADVPPASKNQRFLPASKNQRFLPEPEALARDPIQYAVDRVVKLVNKKLVIALPGGGAAHCQISQL